MSDTELPRDDGPDPDALPLDEVTLRKVRYYGSDSDFYHWSIVGLPESLVAYRLPEVARRKGAEELRRRRQILAMRRG